MVWQDSSSESLLSQVARLGIHLTRSKQLALERAPPSLLTGNAPRLRLREPLEAEATEADLLLQVDEARCREQSRWLMERGQSANDAPYPTPLWQEALLMLEHVRPFTEPFLSFYARFGTWDVASAVQEKLELHSATPVQLGFLPARPKTTEMPLDDSMESIRLSIELTEASQWDRIAETKAAERYRWSCCSNFNEAYFPLMLPVDVSSLRSSVHADGTMMMTDVEPACSVWPMVPQAVVNAVPLDALELANGAFCLRETAPEEESEAAAPPDDWQCAICLDEDKDGAVLVSCGHIFHTRCIQFWYRRSARCPLCRSKCRLGPCMCLPPMDFELESWPMAATAVIAQDTTTPAQERTAASRSTRLLSTAAIDRRRQQLAARFNCAAPSAEFFDEPIVDGCHNSIGRAVVVARSQRHRQEVEVRFQELEAEGSKFTTWPVDGCWPSSSAGLQVEARRAAMLARLAARYLGLQRQRRLLLQARLPQSVAKVLLRQCYKTLSSQAILLATFQPPQGGSQVGCAMDKTNEGCTNTTASDLLRNATSYATWREAMLRSVL